MIRNLVSGVLLALFLIGLAVTLALNCWPLYALDINVFGLERISGLSHEKLMENYKILIDYNNIWGAKTLEFPDFPMSEHGRIHFEEARNIFLAFEWMVPVCGLLTLARLGYEKVSGRRDYRFGVVGGLIAILLPVALAVLCAVSWDTVFVKFHHLFFNNNYWIFDYRTDPVINVLPDGFFLHEAVLIFVLVAVGGGLSIWLARRARKR